MGRDVEAFQIGRAPTYGRSVVADSGLAAARKEFRWCVPQSLASLHVDTYLHHVSIHYIYHMHIMHTMHS